MINNQLGFCMGMAICLFSSNVIADHPTVAFGINGAGPINTISADTLPSGTFAFGIQTEIIDNDAFSAEKLESFADSGLDGVHSVGQITNTSMLFSYGITDDLSISARLPYTKRKTIREAEHGNEEHEDEELGHEENEIHNHGNSSGFGDLLLLGQYRILENDTADVSINFGVKLPTGETHEKDNDGVRFETELQSGSGSWDFLLGVAVSKKSGSFGYHANILYNKTTEGSQSTEIGNALSYNAAITYRVGGNHALHDHSHDNKIEWDFMLELNGEKRNKNKISGHSEEHTGGNAIFLSPGIRASLGQFGGFMSFGMPVVENQNGKQTDFDKRIVAGISFVF